MTPNDSSIALTFKKPILDSFDANLFEKKVTHRSTESYPKVTGTVSMEHFFPPSESKVGSCFFFVFSQL